MDKRGVAFIGSCPNGFQLPEGFSWNARMHDGKRSGKVVVKDKMNRLYAILYYDQDKLNGTSVFYDKGFPQRKITYVNDVANGWGCECDKGKEMKWFFYEDGSVKYELVRKEGMDKYWEKKEITSGVIVSCCQYDHDHKMTGKGYVFENNQVVRVCEFADDKELRLIKELSEQTMDEYDERAMLIYQGEYLNDMKKDYPRNGNGSEIQDGNCVYDGEWVMGVRCGEGTTYNDEGTARFWGHWKDNHPEGYGVLYNEEFEPLYEGQWVNGRIYIEGTNWYDYQTDSIVVDTTTQPPPPTEESEKEDNEPLSDDPADETDSPSIPEAPVEEEEETVPPPPEEVELPQKDLNVSTTSSVFKANDGSYDDITHLHIRNQTSLTQVVIGNSCFAHGREFVVDNCSQLESIEVGENSFNSYHNWGDFSGDDNLVLNKQNRCFKICNCAKLKTLVIKKGSFIDFAGTFDIQSCLSLRLSNRLS